MTTRIILSRGESRGIPWFRVSEICTTEIQPHLTLVESLVRSPAPSEKLWRCFFIFLEGALNLHDYFDYVVTKIYIGAYSKVPYVIIIRARRLEKGPDPSRLHLWPTRINCRRCVGLLSIKWLTVSSDYTDSLIRYLSDRWTQPHNTCPRIQPKGSSCRRYFSPSACSSEWLTAYGRIGPINQAVRTQLWQKPSHQPRVHQA